MSKRKQHRQLVLHVISVLVIASESRKLTLFKISNCISSHFDTDAMHVINMESNFVFFLSNQLPSQQKGKKSYQTDNFSPTCTLCIFEQPERLLDVLGLSYSK